MIAEEIAAKLHPSPADISKVMGDIGALLDDSILGVHMPERPLPKIDLSKIDFAALRSRFAQSKHKQIDVEVLKAAIHAQLNRMIRENKTRADYQEQFAALIESYNNGSRNIESLFAELLKLSSELTSEQQRHIRENLSKEELVLFDILTRPAPPELSADERKKVKQVARELLPKLKELLVLNWRKRTAATSKLRMCIEDVLDQGLPRAYTKELYLEKVAALYEHMYDSYAERDENVYAEGA